MIIYGDSVIDEGECLLVMLNKFLYCYCKNIVNNVYILFFFLYSLDDGFLVIDYFMVNEVLGLWDDIEVIVEDYGLMIDLVINYCFVRSVWFDNFVKGEGLGFDFFFMVDLFDDFFMVICFCVLFLL